jgi:type IV fimbrial biogenesis protein FimT
MNTNRLHLAGFTLVELVCVLAIMAISMALASASFGALIRRTRIDASSRLLFNQLMIARNHAILKSQPVVMCKSHGGRACESLPDWGDGWIIFTDPARNRICSSPDGLNCEGGGKIVFHQPPLSHPGVRVRSNRDTQVLRFNPAGWSEGHNRSFYICDPSVPENSKQIFVARTGRSRMAPLEDPERCQ